MNEKYEMKNEASFYFNLFNVYIVNTSIYMINLNYH
jgi:hypothetical protein